MIIINKHYIVFNYFMISTTLSNIKYHLHVGLGMILNKLDNYLENPNEYNFFILFVLFLTFNSVRKLISTIISYRKKKTQTKRSQRNQREEIQKNRKIFTKK